MDNSDQRKPALSFMLASGAIEIGFGILSKSSRLLKIII